MDQGTKRKDPPSDAHNQDKKVKKSWHSFNKSTRNRTAIEVGDSGIWATCVRGKEGKSIADLQDLFTAYASKLYPQLCPAQDTGENDEDDVGDGQDIEASISAEVSGIKRPRSDATSDGHAAVFEPVRLETRCLLFFKAHAAVQPASFVEQICNDKADGVTQRGCRFVMRLTPIIRSAKATSSGLQEVCDAVLTEENLGQRNSGIKYAIRPTVRDHHVMKTDDIIRQVASAVGLGYAVDLKHPDRVLLVEVYRNMLGLGVVNGLMYQKLKKFNLAEIAPPLSGSLSEPGVPPQVQSQV